VGLGAFELFLGHLPFYLVILQKMVLTIGIEPMTSPLPRVCSTD
jgi:hypothetical protein